MAFDQSYAIADNSELKSERFTCPASLDLVHKLRRCSDAVLVGRGTVERDDCTLTVRRVSLLEGRTEQPVRVVVDPGLKILQVEKGENVHVGCTYSLLKDDLRTIVYHHESADRGNVPLSNMVTLASVKSPTNEYDGTTRISPTQILHDLQARGIDHVMVEGGPATALQFLRDGVVDRAIMIRAPVTFIEPVQSNMSNQVLIDAGLVLLSSMSCGTDIVEYWSKNGSDWPGTLSVDDDDGWPC